MDSAAFPKAQALPVGQLVAVVGIQFVLVIALEAPSVQRPIGELLEMEWTAGFAEPSQHYRSAFPD